MAPSKSFHIVTEHLQCKAALFADDELFFGARETPISTLPVTFDSAIYITLFPMHFMLLLLVISDYPFIYFFM